MGRIRFGLKNFHVAKITEADDGTLSYELPSKIPGAKTMGLSAKGDAVEEHADDGTWYSEDTNDGYDGDVEFEDTAEADEFLTWALGQKKDKNGAIIESTTDQQVEFAFLGQFGLAGGKENGKRFVFYRCKISRPGVEGNTNEGSKKIASNKVKFRALGRLADDQVKATAVSTDACYATWFNKVYETDSTTSATTKS